jgi:hypothetical protein
LGCFQCLPCHMNFTISLCIVSRNVVGGGVWLICVPIWLRLIDCVLVFFQDMKWLAVLLPIGVLPRS